jgi:hypothetical protein
MLTPTPAVPSPGTAEEAAVATRIRYLTVGGAELTLVRPLLLGYPHWHCEGCRTRAAVLNAQDPQAVANWHASTCRAIPRDRQRAA